MGKMERKRNWRPLICLGLRALMKPLLPNIVPRCSQPRSSPPVTHRAQPVEPAAPEKLPRAFPQHGKYDRSRENRPGWALERSPSYQGSALALASRGSPRSGAAAGEILRACLKECLLLVLMGRERATLFEEKADDRRQFEGDLYKTILDETEKTHGNLPRYSAIFITLQ